jgi:phosphinothricin acetyltransferase
MTAAPDPIATNSVAATDVAATDVAVRPARVADLPRLTDIYNHYVTDTAITFDLEPFTVDQRREWLARYADTGRHRLVVAERDGNVVAYASTSPFHPRHAYDTTVEMTVLCAPEAVGHRIGQRLYEALLPMLRDEDIHRAVAAITLPNRGSCELHERFGFTRAATLTEVGRKFDRWWDVAWYVRDMTEQR